jgi:hypothetical protein
MITWEENHIIPGEKMYSTWSVSVMDDPSSQYDLWAQFNIWQNSINNHQTNQSDVSLRNGTVASYKANGWKIHHLDLNGNILKTFVMNGCWPRSINEINFNMARPNAINTFNVVFVFDTIEIYNQTNQITLQ